MNLGRLSINQPILAMVLSIVLLDRRRHRLHHAAGRRISASGSADRRGHHAISGRLGADRLRHRRSSDRAADQRRRGHALSLQPGDLERAADDHRHLQARHRSRQGPGAGSEPRRDRAAAIAGGGAAQRRRHPQEQPGHIDGRVHAVAGRHIRPALHLQLRAAAGSRPAAPAGWHRRHPDFRRARLLDAAVARSRQDRQSRHDRGRRAGGDQGPEPADHRRPVRRAADRRPGVPAQPHLHRPAEGYPAVREHRRQGRPGRAHGAAARRGADRAGRAGLHHQQFSAAQDRGRNAGDAAPRLECAGDSEKHFQCHGQAQGQFSQGARLQYRLQSDRVHRAIRPRADQDHLRGDGARRLRRAAVPAGLASRDHSDRRDTGVAGRYLRGHGGAGICHQQSDPVRPRARGRHRGRRRDRGGRKCRAPPSRRHEPARCGAQDDGGSRRRVGLDCAGLVRGVRADRLPGRHFRTVFSAIRHHHRGGDRDFPASVR